METESGGPLPLPAPRLHVGRSLGIRRENLEWDAYFFKSKIQRAHCVPATGSADRPQTSAYDIGGVRIENVAESGGLPIHSLLSLALSGSLGIQLG